MSVFEHPELKQEDDRVPVARIAAMMVFVVLFSGALALAAYFDDHVREEHLRAHRQRAAENRIGPPMSAPPRGFTRTGEGRALNARKRRELDAYGWADRARGLVRIPIERAMELWSDRAEPSP